LITYPTRGGAAASLTLAILFRAFGAQLPARNANFPLHESFNFERHAFSFCLPNIFGINLKNL